jgi:hypothetical protein
MGNMEISTTVLGTMVMERLRELDRVAYIRYASVYRAFQDIESFEEAVRDLRDESQLPLLDMPPALPKRGRRRAVEPDAEFRPAQTKASDKKTTGKKTTGRRTPGRPRNGSPQPGLLKQE